MTSTASALAFDQAGKVVALGNETFDGESRPWLAQIDPCTAEVDDLFIGKAGEVATGLDCLPSRTRAVGWSVEEPALGDAIAAPEDRERLLTMVGRTLTALEAQVHGPPSEKWSCERRDFYLRRWLPSVTVAVDEAHATSGELRKRLPYGEEESARELNLDEEDRVGWSAPRPPPHLLGDGVGQLLDVAVLAGALHRAFIGDSAGRCDR